MSSLSLRDVTHSKHAGYVITDPRCCQEQMERAHAQALKVGKVSNATSPVMRFGMSAFCCIHCHGEGTLSMEWPILHGSRCLVPFTGFFWEASFPLFYAFRSFPACCFFLASSLRSFCPGSLESSAFEGWHFP